MKQVKQGLESGTFIFLNRDAVWGIERLPQSSGLNLMETPRITFISPDDSQTVSLNLKKFTALS